MRNIFAAKCFMLNILLSIHIEYLQFFAIIKVLEYAQYQEVHERRLLESVNAQMSFIVRFFCC